MTRYLTIGRYVVHACLILAPGGLAIIGAYYLIRRLRQKRLQTKTS